MKKLIATGVRWVGLVTLAAAMVACNGSVRSLLVVEIDATDPGVPPLAQLRVRAAGIERLSSGDVRQKVGLYLPPTFAGEVVALVEGLDGGGGVVARGMSEPVVIAPGETRSVRVALAGLSAEGHPPATDAAGLPEPDAMAVIDGPAMAGGRDAAAPADGGLPAKPDAGPVAPSPDAASPDVRPPASPDVGLPASPDMGPPASPDVGPPASPDASPDVGPPVTFDARIPAEAAPPGVDGCLPPGEDKVLVKITRAGQVIAQIDGQRACHSRAHEANDGQPALLDLHWYAAAPAVTALVRTYVDIGAVGTFMPFGVVFRGGDETWSGWPPGTCRLNVTTYVKIGEDPWPGGLRTDIYKVAGNVVCDFLRGHNNDSGNNTGNAVLEQFDFVTRVGHGPQ